MAFHHGDPQAQSDFNRRYLPWLTTIVSRILGFACLDENVATVLGCIWERARQFHAMSSLKTWLTVVTRNWCIDTMRHEKARPAIAATRRDEATPHPLERIAARQPTAAQQLACQQFCQFLGEATRLAALQLPPQQRAILRLRYLEGLSQAEMSRRPELLEKGESELQPYALTRRVQRAARALRVQLVEELERHG